MKAWILSKNGIDNLNLKEVEKPQVKAGQVLVKVKAVGLNPVDSMVIDLIPVNSEKIPGAEFAGEIEEVGEGVKELKKGDRVSIYNRYFDSTCSYCKSGNEMLCDNGYIFSIGSNGGLAEYIVIDGRNAFKLPDSVNFELAASLPVAALTSYNALERAKVQKNEFVVVIGASGNTGVFALQFAKMLGAKTIAISSKNWVKDFGADYVIGYENALEEVRKITNSHMADVVIESIGEKFWDLGYSLLGKNGRMVAFGTETGSNAKIDISQLYSKQLSILGSTSGSVKQFSEVVNKSKDLKIKTWKKFNFQETKEAFKENSSKEKDGRIIIEL
ncbi:alcohol dehydrogenase catalytic domain-containing protein [Candidatus Parvarchaeota archaeon]|nr:alcohol dehydrogenase catalytic domain-containing protein [Candidatus Parvarchaeota archaeon]